MSDRELTFQPHGSVLRAVRADVRRIAAGLGAEPSVCDNLALVVDELVNNAIEHGAAYRSSSQDLRVAIDTDGDLLVIEFFDPEMPEDQVRELSLALSATASGMPSLDSERGRGLFLLSVYLEDLRAERAEQGGLRLSGRIQRQ
ncbi:MAG: ATP-binding protein [Planctomycetes bacterium]|nr:ATP-binding protein [Planctomycetota bacterium]